MAAKMIKIAIFSTNDVTGGAARACARLNYGLLKHDKVDVDYYVSQKREDSVKTKVLRPKMMSQKKVENIINQNYIANNRSAVTNTLFSFSYADTELTELESYDIINLHWIENFISLNNLYELTKLNKPIIWTLHDMKAFTGGCHYSAGCEKFRHDCSECPQLNSDPKELTFNTLELKKKILENANITVVTPSEWLAKEARNSALFNDTRVEVIPYGVDTSIFKPMDKIKAKQELNLDKDTVVLTFGVMDQNETRKGFKELYEAMKILNTRLAGRKTIGLFFGLEYSGNFPIPVINLGRIESDEKLALIYSAADIFILPSLEDNFPNTMLESLACQTPVIAFDTGGAKDIISNEDGKVVQRGNVKALSDEIYELINNQELRELKGRRGRKLIEDKYQLHHQADAYFKLFKTLRKKQFSYVNKELNVHSCFETLVGFTLCSLSGDKDYLASFVKDYNGFFNRINMLRKSADNYVVYGNGSIGKTIQALIPEKIIGFVDMLDVNNHPTNLQSMKYDKIIISVLGREEEIIRYLIEELGLSRSKMVILSA